MRVHRGGFPDGKAPYTASCKQRIPEIHIPQIQLGNTTVAVRANPAELTQIALDFATEPPVVTTPGGSGNHSAAEILATGVPGRAVIVQYEPLGKRNPAGVDLYAFMLTVMPHGGDPYQIQVGNPAPPAALPYLFPGSRVPVKIGTNPNAVVIDWEAATAEDRRWPRRPSPAALAVCNGGRCTGRKNCRPHGACYLRRVEVRSLGYITDLAILALEGSQVTDRGDHLVIRTPGNPNYWWGNFLLLRDLRPGSGGGWMARFAAEFPDARHAALGLDDTGDVTVDPGEFAGMTVERNSVMTATSVHAPPRPNTEAVLRTLEGDADWRQSLELAAAVHPGDAGDDAGFLATRLAARRALTEAGHGAWFGAFLDGTLVSQLGLIMGKSGPARYQSVETHPAARRRGLAGTLVWQAGATVLTGGRRTLVMVADPEEGAIRVYRSVGFTSRNPSWDSPASQPDRGLAGAPMGTRGLRASGAAPARSTPSRRGG